MAIELNHTIIWAKDKLASTRFLADILGVEAGPQWARFVPVQVGGVTLDFAHSAERHRQHYAFLVGEEEFDAAFGRIRAAGVNITPSTTAAARERSTITTAGVASISTHPTATCSS
jgi:hypothetical protein